MCMLFGFSAQKSYKIDKTIEKFFNFSYRHPHGWGIAVYNSMHDSPQLVKEPRPAHMSNFAKDIISRGIIARMAIAHIRYATCGEKHYNNTHPFVHHINGRQWVFAHNGSVQVDEDGLVEYLPYGETDSEKVFCILSEELSKIKQKGIEDEISCIESVVEKLAEKGKLNLIISDGTYMFIHSNYRNSLYRYNTDEMACFTTKPIQQDRWEAIQLNTLLVYKDGNKIYQGRTHRNEYMK